MSLFQKEDIKKLLIFGVGNFSQTVYRYFKRYTDYKIMGFIDDNTENIKVINKLPVFSLEEVFQKMPNDKYIIFVAVGYKKMNNLREKYFNIFKDKGYKMASFIHPNVIWWDDSLIGENCFIFENNIVQSGVKIGNNTILWSGNHIGHHSLIDENVWITSHAVIYSHVQIKNNCFIGSNANIKENIICGESSFIGAGSNIWANTNKKSVYSVKQTKPLSLNSDILNV